MSLPTPAQKPATVVGIERLLDIFEAFQLSQRPLSLTDLAEAANIPKSTCHAIVATLSSRGYLYSLSRPRALYPTKRMYDVALDILKKDPFLERATPLLERLRDTSRETVILGKRQGDSVVYLQVIESLQSIRYSAKTGDIKPMHSSSIGKALLGSLKETELRHWLAEKPLPAITSSTITDPEKLADDILQSRQLGYFQTRGENVSDVWAVSAFLKVDKETFAIAIAGPKHRMEASLPECAHLLVATCSFLSHTLCR
ncbi:MAG: IclR family transcriptional regulator [Pollutimonas bauzanensis]|uniref:Transcriptional regulator, IclR family n=2 Tax=Pollutimonas bauzanensis TaxID=658167 RepID=A0A1M5XXF0_9BURK|nr:transcriptional regulator, IclR family [Pollutimonas bauzanensis]